MFISMNWIRDFVDLSGLDLNKLIHQFGGFFLASKHCIERHLQLLELTANLDDILNKLLHGKSTRNLGCSIFYRLGLSVKPLHFRCSTACLDFQLIYFSTGFVKSACKPVFHQYFYFYRFYAHFLRLL